MSDEKLYCPVANEIRAYMREGRVAMQQIANSERRLTLIEDKARHLESLRDIAEALRGVRDDLIAPATGRKQIPLSSALLLFAFMGIICILLLVNNTRKNIDLGWNHIRITTGPEAGVESAEHK